MNSNMKPARASARAGSAPCAGGPLKGLGGAAAAPLHRPPRMGPVCHAAKRAENREEDEAAPRRREPWWCGDAGHLSPPRRPHHPSSAAAGGAPAAADWRAARARLLSLERAGLLCAPPPPPPPPGAWAAPPARSGGSGSSGSSSSAHSSGGGGGGGALLPSVWAHELAAPEVGCLLVARRQRGGGDFFDDAVVLVAAHDEAQGSIGFVLNRASPLRLADVAASSRGGALASVADVFGAQRLLIGGPVHLETLTVLHGYGGAHGAQRVLDGVYYGGLPAAAEMVRGGLAAPSDFRLLLGLAGWAPGQLEEEVANGAWRCVAASKAVIMPPGGGGGAAAAGPPAAMRRRVLALAGRGAGQRAQR